jgi:hypothetical protein
MATKVNTTNVALSELETAPGGGTPSDFDFFTSGRRGWNVGIQGDQSFGLYTWGFGAGSAASNANPIYGLTPSVTTNAPLLLGNWRGLQYWFDGTTFDVVLSFKSNQASVPPPGNDVVDIQLVITDDSGNFSIFRQAPNTPPNYEIFVNIGGGQTQSETQISGFQPDEYVLAANLYWYIEVAAGPDFPGGQLDFDISGTNVLSVTLAAGPFTGDLYDWTTNTMGNTDTNGIVLNFTIN